MTPEQIAKGLTDAQRTTLARGRWPEWMREKRTQPTKAALERKGLCTFTHVIAAKGDWTLTPLGQQVRAILEQQP